VIIGLETFRRESLSPIARRLFIDVPRATLPWLRSGEDNHVCSAREKSHETIAQLPRQMLSDLETVRNIKVIANPRRGISGEIKRSCRDAKNARKTPADAAVLTRLDFQAAPTTYCCKATRATSNVNISPSVRDAGLNGVHDSASVRQRLP
jgi:hypothetical protein